MTAKEKQTLTEYRRQGLGYKKIAQLMGVSENTVKTYCKRNNLAGEVAVRCSGSKVTRCKACGEPLVQIAGRKPRIFCSSACRNAWWNSHPSLIHHRDGHQIACGNCGKELNVSKNSTIKYCSHACYVTYRFHGGAMR